MKRRESAATAAGMREVSHRGQEMCTPSAGSINPVAKTICRAAVAPVRQVGYAPSGTAAPPSGSRICGSWARPSAR